MILKSYKITSEHFESFYKLRTDKNNIYWSGHSTEPNKQNLKKWFENQINSSNRVIYVFYYNEDIAGYLYIDKVNKEEAEVSFGVHESLNGRGIGTQIIGFAVEKIKEMSYKRVSAFVSELNVGSMKVFNKNLFKTTKVYELRYIEQAKDHLKFIKLERTL
jgi:RimJ/RimL family protein N-acetyltransferase